MDDKHEKHGWREIVSDCMLVGGGFAVCLGVGLLHVAAGIITAGVLSIVYGWLIGLGGEMK